MRQQLPKGTVTFLFTDIEGSTKLLRELGDAYADALAEHRRLLRTAFSAEGGVEVDTQGDAFFYAFADAAKALQAAQDAQRALEAGPIPVRMGLHTGEPRLTAEGYVGLDVHLAARVAASAHGGQVVLSRETQSQLHNAFLLLDLGEHRLKDFAEPVWIYQLGDDRFPPLKTISNTNLPHPASSFVGRAQELSEVVSLVREGARLVTLSGPGGSGKTRLAIEVASELVPEFRAGVFWVGLSALREPALVTETIAQTLGAKEELAVHIGQRQFLLLLDNLEQVIESAPALVRILSMCPNLQLLVTSRELLRVQGEVDYAVRPLAQPEAVELFCARARLEPDGVIAELCRRLDQLPLAVELAAARTSALSPAQILERLSQRLDLLTGGRDADPRQQTLRAAIEWSYELLDANEQQLFARLSVFAGGCALETAEQVTDAELDVLQSLVEKSLLRHSGERFWMLETIREFAAERLEESAERDELDRRHAQSVVGLARELARGVRHLEPDAVARMGVEYDNVRAALAWSVAGGDPRIGAELLGRLCVYWVTSGSLSEGVSIARRVLEVQASLPPRERVAAMIGASELLRFRGELEEAADLNEQVLVLLGGFEREDFPILYGQSGSEVAISTLKDLASMYASLGDLRLARVRADDALSRAKELGNEWLIANCIFAKAEVEFWAGRFAEAGRLYASTLPTWESAASLAEVALTHCMLGECARRQGMLDEAVAELRAALDAARSSRALSIQPEVFQELAVVAAMRDRPELSATLLGASERLRQEAGLPLWDRRDFERAVDALRRHLGDVRLEEAWTAGRAVTDEQAIELALSVA